MAWQTDWPIDQQAYQPTYHILATLWSTELFEYHMWTSSLPILSTNVDKAKIPFLSSSRSTTYTYLGTLSVDAIHSDPFNLNNECVWSVLLPVITKQHFNGSSKNVLTASFTRFHLDVFNRTPEAIVYFSQDLGQTKLFPHNLLIFVLFPCQRHFHHVGYHQLNTNTKINAKIFQHNLFYVSLFTLVKATSIALYTVLFNANISKCCNYVELTSPNLVFTMCFIVKILELIVFTSSN